MEQIKFGTDGWRAKMDESFTPENVALVVKAVASYLKDEKEWEKGVFIGYDTRQNSDYFAQKSADIFADEEIPVWLAPDFMPTPLTAFAVIHKGLAGALMFTASHNPPGYNGVKFIPEYGGPAFPEITGSIENRISGIGLGKPVSCPSIYRYYNPLPDYLEHLKKIIDFELIAQSGLKIVLDPMFGAAINVFGQIFEGSAREHLVIHGERDTDFGGSLPDPSEEKLGQLKEIVLKNQYDLGLALDGDGDRSGLIDATGRFIGANQALALIADYRIKVKEEKGSVVRTVATTHLIDAVARKYGRKLIETPVGFKHIAKEMLAGDVVAGGEESGGLSAGCHIPEKDGIFANLVLTEITAHYGKPLSAILEELYLEHGRFYNKRLDLEIDKEAKIKMLQSLADNPPDVVKGRGVVGADSPDGIRLTLENGDWLLVRASGTEDLVRVYIETNDLGMVSAYEDFFIDYLKKSS